MPNISENCSMSLNAGEIVVSMSHHSEFCDIDNMNFDPAHIHSDFEIYVNVSGDVSFMHGQSVYKTERGDVIFSYPGDVHYCIYRESCIHEHFCLRFNCEAAGVIGNLLAENNLSGFIRKTASVKEKIIELSGEIIANRSKFDIMRAFLTLISILKEGRDESARSEAIPKRVSDILSYIDENLTSIKMTEDIARAFFISKPTLDRLFREYVHISVHKFLEAKRLSLSESLLKNGATVTEACYGAGFSDCSRFIAKFKEKFGKTPLKYKAEK